MSVWNKYDAKHIRSTDRRDNLLKKEQRFLRSKLPDNLSYHSLLINGEDRNAAVINSDNYDIKTLCSLPGEDLPHGGTVLWMNNHWLITERDANNEVYTRCKMRQCNYLLRWIAEDGTIQERWCIAEDGTKYLTGEYGDNYFILNRGDTRLALTITKDEYTLKLKRENRFLIDDYGSDTVLAYRLTKPLKLGGSYDSTGVLFFVMTECNTEDDDNLDLHIANYYRYFPRETEGEDGSSVSGTPEGQVSSENTEKAENGGWI